MSDAFDPAGPDSPDPVGWRERLQRISRWRRPSKRVQGILLIVASVGVAIGVVLSIRTLDVGWQDLRWAPIAAAALLVTPATIVLNGAELKVMGSIVSRDERTLSWGDALRATLTATAANLLPLPGGALVRITAIRAVGVSTSSATVVNLVGAGLWVAMAMLVAAVAGAGLAPWWAVGVAAALGLAGLVVSLGMIHRLTGGQGAVRATATLSLVELATAVVHGLRLWLMALALGLVVSVQQGLTLSAGAPLAKAAGIFPAGLGLAEALTALVAVLVGLPAAAGFTVTALGRVVGLVAAAPITLYYGITDLRRQRHQAPDPTQAPATDRAAAEPADPHEPT